MNDREQIEKLYQDMYAAMVNKDEKELDRIHDDSFVLYHMTGMRQDKNEYIRSILNGALNYYKEETAQLEISVSGEKAQMKGLSKVTAAVFGGGRHTWRLQLEFRLLKKDGEWRLCEAQASTW